jgi:pimeloyl-ACP methyl ester carboxylesterase
MRRARPLAPDSLFPAGVPDITTRFISLSTGIRMRVAERVDGDGQRERGRQLPAVVMLHGWGGSLYMFRHALDLLPTYGVRPIAADLRGYGLSDKPLARDSYSLNNYCADVDALLDSLSVTRVTLVGQSMGGGLALRYALRRPERISKLVLINPTGLVPLKFLKFLVRPPRALLGAIGGRLVPRWLVEVILRRLAYGNAALVTERDIDEYWAPTQLPGFTHAVSAAIREFDWRPLSPAEAASLAVPSVVILGTRDRLVRNTPESAERLRGSLVHSMDGGHCVHEERPREACEIIGQFACDSAR